jgi:hypothetical protein
MADETIVRVAEMYLYAQPDSMIIEKTVGLESVGGTCLLRLPIADGEDLQRIRQKCVGL